MMIKMEVNKMAVRTTTKKNAENEVMESIQTKFEAYTGNEPYLFVSYSHMDTAKVYPILDALYDRKFRIWYDESCENGSDFRDELRERIKKSEAVVLFVSQYSMLSPFCGMEIIVARENNKRLYPIYIDDVAIPPAFEILLANTHHSTADNMDKLMKAMVRDLPEEAMDRLSKSDDGVKIVKCEDNGKSIEVDEGIKEICDRAFKNRKELHHIILPSTLETIGVESFRGCNNIEEMDIPEKTTKIGESAFRDCVSMKTLSIKNDLIKIGERAFENCANVETIDLPDGLTEIYGGVFNSCKKLEHIELPSKLTILGENAFADCEKLEEVKIPKLVTKIDDFVFNGCKNLKKIELNDGLRKIGKSTFKNCESLEEILIPATVSCISDSPFRGCKGLKSIRVEPKNKFYKSETNTKTDSDEGHILFNKNKSVIIAYPANFKEVVQYVIPDSVTCISSWTFCDCKVLSRIAIPDSVCEIGEGAFCNCVVLDQVEIPDSVTKIDDCAFRGCTGLTEIKIPNSVKDLGWGIFDGCENNVVVKCCENSEIYKYCQQHNIKISPATEADFD